MVMDVRMSRTLTPASQILGAGARNSVHRDCRSPNYYAEKPYYAKGIEENRLAYEELLAGLILISFAATLFALWRISKLQTNLTKTHDDLAGKIAPFEAISGVTSGLTTSFSSLQSEIGNIKQQAERIATLGEKYAETESLTRTIHGILIGSYSKGRTGEQILKRVMAELMRAGIVEGGVYFGTRIVEYAVKFPDGKYLAVDSKFVGTGDLEKLHDDKVSEIERKAIADSIVSDLRGKIDEVAGYIDPDRTLPYALMAIPDSLLEYAPELIGDASRRNVIVAAYSSVPPLIEYFVKIHASYLVQQDAKLLVESIAKVDKALNKFNEKYFSKRFDTPIQTLSKAIGEVKGGVSKALDAVDVSKLALPQVEQELPKELEVVSSPDESAKE